MSFLRKRKEGDEQEETGKKSAVNVAQSAWRGLIGYNDTEANRLGVPYVSSRDWLGDIFAEPGSRVRGNARLIHNALC